MGSKIKKFSWRRNNKMKIQFFVSTILFYFLHLDLSFAQTNSNWRQHEREQRHLEMQQNLLDLRSSIEKQAAETDMLRN